MKINNAGKNAYVNSEQIHEHVTNKNLHSTLSPVFDTLKSVKANMYVMQARVDYIHEDMCIFLISF